MKKVQILAVNSSQGGPINRDCLIGPLLNRQQMIRASIQQHLLQLEQLFPSRKRLKNERIQILNQQISHFSQTSVEQEQRFMVISGDHSSAMGTWAGVLNGLRSDKQFGLLWLDAHLDAHTYVNSPSGNCHGMPVAALLVLQMHVSDGYIHLSGLLMQPI